MTKSEYRTGAPIGASVRVFETKVRPPTRLGKLRVAVRKALGIRPANPKTSDELICRQPDLMVYRIARVDGSVVGTICRGDVEVKV